MKKIIALLALVVLINGCATMPISQATSINRVNLLKLSVGMTKEGAINTMGTKTLPAYAYSDKGAILGIYTNVTINNPYRSELVQGKNNREFEIIYYVTDVKGDNAAISDDDLTPLVFDNGKLIGWGWSFLKDNTQR